MAGPGLAQAAQTLIVGDTCLAIVEFGRAIAGGAFYIVSRVAKAHSEAWHPLNWEGRAGK